MKEIRNYIIIENKKELKESNIIWEDEESVEICMKGLFLEAKKIKNFPCAYELVDTLDHGCKVYAIADNEKVLADINAEIKELNSLKKMLDI